jgi:Ser/Thr protein kinase RdoA (MazF antagonist)
MQDFFSLTPDAVLGAVEQALDPSGQVRATGRCFAHASMENRVYEIELEEPLPQLGNRIIAKFYRPGRWSEEALWEEHSFLRELAEAEVPVVAPIELAGADRQTLHKTDFGVFFSIFPKASGRVQEELSDEQLLQVGRLLARLHNVGASRPAPHRPRLIPNDYLEPALAHLSTSGLIDPQLQSRYERAVRTLMALATPLWDSLPLHRVHGDCHGGNLLWQASGPVFLDFDDLMMAPAVQDLWMVIRGRDRDAQQQRQTILEGYEQLRSFDHRSLRLIEALRGLRMVHYAGWVARRYADPIFQRTFPDFPSHSHWADETAGIEEQIALLQTSLLEQSCHVS